MKDELSALEERVERAALRIRDLASERRRLEAELLALRERIERLESSDPAAGDADVRRWGLQREDVLATVRESIELLQD